MKRILITGNSGYIGSHLTKMLQGKYVIHGLDREFPQIQTNIHYRRDIRDDLTNLSHYDAVIHLAALVNVGESQTIPGEYYDVNLNGTLNVLKQVKTTNFIFASTGAAEKCESAYGISKRAAEDCVREQRRDQDFTIFRFYNVIGSDGIKPTNPDGLFYNLMQAQTTGKFTIYGDDYATSDGTCVRDYVHVNEICDALATAIESPTRALENLGHGKGNTVKNMVDLFQQVNNCSIDVAYGPRREGDIEISVLDNPSKLMKELYTLQDLLKV